MAGIVGGILSGIGIIQESGIISGAVKAYFFDSKVDKTRDAVQKILQQAHQVGESLLASGFSGISMQRVEFFNALNLQLQNFTVAYADMLDMTVDKISRSAANALFQMDTMVHDWARELTGPKMEKQVAELKGIALSFPLVKDSPKVTAFFPVFVAPTKENCNVQIECIGQFPSVDGDRADLRPSISIRGKKFEYIQNPSLKIYFSVPFDTLFSREEKPSNMMQTTSFTVRIPYLQKGWVCNGVVNYDFQGSLTLLPDFPGKVVLQFKKPTTSTENKDLHSQVYLQNSRKDALNKTVENKPYTLSTEPGWNIVAGSSKFHVVEKKGTRQTSSWNLSVDQPTSVTYNVSTFHYDPPFKHCDKLTFQITAVMRRVISKTEVSSEEVRLKWGDSMGIDASKGDCSAMYHCFDGTSQFLQLNTFGPYMTYVMRNGQIVLGARSPEYISSFNFHLLVPMSRY